MDGPFPLHSSAKSSTRKRNWIKCSEKLKKNCLSLIGTGVPSFEKKLDFFIISTEKYLLSIKHSVPLNLNTAWKSVPEVQVQIKRKS